MTDEGIKLGKDPKKRMKEHGINDLEEPRSYKLIKLKARLAVLDELREETLTAIYELDLLEKRFNYYVEQDDGDDGSEFEI